MSSRQYIDQKLLHQDQLAKVRHEQLFAAIGDTKSQIAEWRTETKSQIADLRTETKNQIAELRTETKNQIDNLESHLDTKLNLLMWKLFVRVSFGTAAIGSGLVSAVLFFFGATDGELKWPLFNIIGKTKSESPS